MVSGPVEVCKILICKILAKNLNPNSIPICSGA